MRARRREINIFNMSLLDILCGALGAFCFMMLVALPYYKPPGEARDLKKAQEETQKLMRDLEKMKERLPDQKSVEEMEELLRRLEAQVKALQGQVNILSAEKEELQRQMQQLTAEKQQLVQENQTLRTKNQEVEEANQKLQALLAEKKPFTVLATADNLSQGLDLILFKTSLAEEGLRPIFQGWLRGDYNDLHALRSALFNGRGIGLFVSGESPGGSEAKLFLRLTNSPETRQKTSVVGGIVSDEKLIAPVRLPRVTLDPQRFWILLGKVTIDQNHQPHFQEATAEEREATWEKLTGSTPPPTATPSPTSTEEERKKERERVTQQRQLQLKFVTLMRLRPSQETDQSQILQVAEELLQEMPANDSRRKIVISIREQTLDRKSRQGQGSPAISPTP